MSGVVGRKLRGLARRLALRAPAIEEIDFHSGLGDSALLLYGLARALKPEVAVEIGSARGKSACYVGRALEENGKGKVYAIDPHMPTAWNDENSVDTFAEMSGNVRKLGLAKRVEIVRQTSDSAAVTWTRPIDMIFIDGDHSYEGVKRDWNLFTPFVRPFGVVVFHDTLWDLKPESPYARADMGVPAFVEELRSQGYPVVTIDRDFGVSIVQPSPGGLSLRT